MIHKLRFRAALLVAVILAFGAAFIADAGAQQQAVELPAEVTRWMERDQVQRWARMIRRGQELFAEGSCANCHGEGGSGGNLGPDLTDTEWVQGDGSLENVFDTIFWGVRRRDFADPNRRFQMNPGGGMDLEFEDVGALAAYVWSLNNGTFLPQR